MKLNVAKATNSGANFGTYITNTPANYIITWFKTYIEGDTAVAMQGLVSCKDFLVDTYYQEGTSEFRRDNWTKEQIRYPSIGVQMNEYTLEVFKKNLETYWNPKETEMGCSHTKINTVTEIIGDIEKGNRPLHIITFDPIWMINATSISVFYSILRMMMTQENMTKVDFKSNSTESSYFTQLSAFAATELIEIYKNYYNNPQQLWINMEELGYTDTGYKAGYIPQHGITGFYSMFRLPLYFGYGADAYCNLILNSYYCQKHLDLILKYSDTMEVYKKYIKKEETRVRKMQSLQQEINRGRVTETVPTTPRRTPRPAVRRPVW